MPKTMEKISLDELKKLVQPEFDALELKFDAIASERNVKLLKGVVKKKLLELIEDLHVKAFVKNKMRKARRWARKQWDKMWDW